MRAVFIAGLLLVACAPPPPPAGPIEIATTPPPDDRGLRLSEEKRMRQAELIEELKAENAELRARVAALEAESESQDRSFSLADATVGLAGSGALTATIKTSMGDLRCRLFDDKAPVTVANFVGLARGVRRWKDSSGSWVKKRAYDATTFHRVIKGFMIQGGDPLGNGTGEPGYVFDDEIWAGAKHDRAGLLCMANRGPNTNGAQFFVTDASAPHLDRSYTIFGECSPLSVVHAIAGVATGPSDRPTSPITIQTIEITRATGPKKP